MTDQPAIGAPVRVTPARLMLVVTAVTGVLGWVCIAVAGHRLGPAGYARFSVVWGLLFGLGGAFSGLQQEVTRSAYRARPGDSPVWRPAALVAASFCVLAAVLVVVSRPSGLGGAPGPLLLVVAALAGFAAMTFVNGVLSSADQWRWVAAVLLLDAGVRAVAVATVLDQDHTGNAVLVVVIGAGPFAWLVLLGSPTMRGALVAPGLDPSGFVWRAWSAILSAACTSTLVAGFPFLLALVNSGPLDATTGALLAGLVLVRSPLLLVVFGLRPVLMRAFLRSSRPVRHLVRLWAWCLGVGLVGAAATFAMGAPLLRLVMGADFRLPASHLVVLLAGSVELGMLTVSGLALIALDAHLLSTAGWLTAVVATVALLAAPGSTDHAMLLSLGVGPLAGLAVHAVALRRTG